MANKEPNISWKSFGLLVILALAVAANFRFPLLDSRPMHTDEAILATKYVEFWKTGVFAYDNKDYHGPGLHNLTRAFGWVARWSHPDELTDAKLRLVVAVCSMGLILVTLLGVDALGRMGTAMAMIFMAVSPMMVFYSRYFIMEVPLVFWVAVFLFSCWRHAQSKNVKWLILAGCALGFQHATKETFILNLGAAACGWIAAKVVCGGFSPKPTNRLSLSPSKRGVKYAWIWVLVPAVIMSVALFSSGFKNWQAVKDSITTYGHYLTRSTGAGHEKPWNYYLTLILWRKDGLLWTEAMIAGLGVVGMLNAFLGSHRNVARQAFLVFLSIYTLALLTVYSLLSYKTPWSILGAHYSLILLAGAGAAVIWHWLEGRITKTILAVLLVIGTWHLCIQSGRAIHGYRADPRNPYVYSHTSTNLLDLVKRVQDLQRLRPAGFSVQVIDRDYGWPLPWYFRKMADVGYQLATPEQLKAPVIIADSDRRDEVETRLAGHPYESSSIYGLRPNVMLVVFIEQALWEQFKAQNIPQTPPNPAAKPKMHE